MSKSTQTFYKERQYVVMALTLNSASRKQQYKTQVLATQNVKH